MAQVVSSDVAVAELARAIDGLQALELHDLSDDDLSRLVVELEVQRSRLGGFGAAVVRAFDRRGAWALDGAKSAAAWIAHRCRLPLAAARKATRMARRLCDLPATRAALEAGEITEAHAERLVRAATRERRKALARDEAMLVGHAKELSFAEFHKAVTYWEQLADPDGVEDAADAEEAGRRFHLSPSLHGSWAMDGHADPIRGTIIHNVLSPIERELFQTDWAEAKAKHGDDVTVDMLARTPAQRRLDALVEMAIRAATAPKDGQRPRPLFTVLCDHPTFAGRVCELANGTPPRPARPLAHRRRHRTGRLRRGITGHRRREASAPLPRRHPPRRRGPRSRLLAPHLRHTRRRLRHRPHRALRTRRAHRAGQRPTRLPTPQRRPPQTPHLPSPSGAVAGKVAPPPSGSPQHGSGRRPTEMMG